MHGSLALASGVLWVGSHEKTAHVRAFDLDGRSLGRGFSFRDERFPHTAVTGLAVDPDHRIWVADRPASRVRVFTLFGAEVASHGALESGTDRDRPLPISDPTDVCLVGDDLDEPFVLVGSGGRRRHAARVLEAAGPLVTSLRPLGDPQGSFHDVRGVAAGGRFAYVCEATAGRVQVFRDLDFHFALGAGERAFRPVAAAPTSDGRLVVASAGPASRLVVFDRGGRPREVLAGPGAGDGGIEEPGDLALAEGVSDRESRLFVLDRDGGRIQVFNLEGRCYGAFEDL